MKCSKNNDNMGRHGFGDKMMAFLRSKGVYVVLFVCLAAVGAAAALIFASPAESGGSKAGPTPPLEPASLSGDERINGIFGKQTPLPTLQPSATLTPDFTPASSDAPATPRVSAEKVSAPVSGGIIWEFAVDELIYSRTLEHWTTHSGVDIESPLGTEVHAVMSGTVEDVYKDDRIGVTVVISHSNGVSTLYASLKEEPPVKKGDKVNKGDVIGYVGKTAVSECADRSHLHFEYIKDGKTLNPREYVLFDK